MSRRRRGSIEEFDAAARAHGLRYAEAQKRETMEQVVEPIRAIPQDYRKVSEWKKIKEEGKGNEEK